MITTIYDDRKYYGYLNAGGNYLMHHRQEGSKNGVRHDANGYPIPEGSLPDGYKAYPSNIHRQDEMDRADKESEKVKPGSYGESRRESGSTGSASGNKSEEGSGSKPGNKHKSGSENPKPDSGNPKPDNKKTALQTIADAVVTISRNNNQKNKGGQNGQNDQNKPEDKFTIGNKALGNVKATTENAQKVTKNLEDLSNMRKSNKDAKAYDDNVSKFKKESLSKMSDAELDSAINEWTDKRLNEVARLEKEKSLTTLMYGNRPTEKTGAEKINAYLTAAGSVAATAASVALLMSELNKLRS